MILQLRANGSTIRLYRWMDKVWRDFIFRRHPSLWRDEKEPEKKFTDLCTLVRTIVILGPLALLSNLLTVAWVIYVISYFGFMLWLNLPGLWIAILFIGLLFGVGGLAIGGLYLLGWAAQRAVRSESATVIKAYYKAKKEDFCPFVEITDAP